MERGRYCSTHPFRLQRPEVNQRRTCMGGWCTISHGWECHTCWSCNPHDRKGGGLVVLILDFSRETLFPCPFQIVFSHSSLMVKPHACRIRHVECQVSLSFNWVHPVDPSGYEPSLESVHTVLTQPGTLIFRCFPFPENSGTPTFPISGNSGLRHFLLLVIRSCISPFTCDSIVSPCFMLLFLLMYSGLSLYLVHTYPTP